MTVFIEFIAYVNLAVSWVLMILALWGGVAFYPHAKDRGDNGPSYLILAIWLGFVGVGLNAFYWKVFADIALRAGWFDVAQLRLFGNTAGDILFKGLGAASVYLHFVARWKFLSDEERKKWSPLLMGWYPDEKSLFVRTFRLLNRRKGL